jgi:hypothetical protein
MLRWVKVAGLIVAILALLLIVMLHLRGGAGGHGPGRHFGGQASDPPGFTDAADIAGHKPREGGRS